MSGTACSSACGWCGACSSSWEGPQTTACVRCGGDAPIPDGGDYRSITWCEACEAKARRRREQREEPGYGAGV